MNEHLEEVTCTMRIEINTDNTVTKHAAMVAHIESVVTDALLRFDEHISRVEVHLSVVNDHRQKGGEHRCVMEARMEHHSPIAATDQTENLHQAIHGAAEKLKRTIGHTLGRIGDSTRHPAHRSVTESEPDVLQPDKD